MRKINTFGAVNFVKILGLLCAGVFLVGCATTGSNNQGVNSIVAETNAVAMAASENPTIASSVRRLINDFLEDQKKGGINQAKFGSMSAFVNLEEYQLIGWGQDSLGATVYKAKVKASGRIGNATWTTADFYLKQTGIQNGYSGIQIATVFTTRY